MRVASFFRARLTWQQSHKRRFALRKALESGVHAFQIFEGVHARRASSKFARCLRSAQKQLANYGNFRAIKIKCVLKAMLEFGNAAVARADRTYKRLRFQMIQGFADLVFLEMQNWIAVRLLVARVGESVQRERIILRRGDFFFDQRPENACFDGREGDLHVFNSTERRI